MKDRRKIYKEIFIIVFLNVLAHGFLLFLSGTFWDDWEYIYHNKETLWNQFMAAGIPSRAIIIELVWNIPDYGYRGVVFLAFLFMTILFYLILLRIPFFEDRDCLIIPLLFTIVPLNDCRVILCDVPYTIGLLFFFLGFYLLTIWFEKRYLLLRIMVHICFLLSFTINSLLFFYAIVLLYIYLTEYVQQKNIVKSLVRMIYYSDFVISPGLFFIVKQILFPTYGPYANYNQINIRYLIHSLIALPWGICQQLLKVWEEFFKWIPIPWIAKILLLYILYKCITVFIATIKQFRREQQVSIFLRVKEKLLSRKICGLLLGIIIFGFGMYPYMVIRGTTVLSTDGVGSRDTMLLPIGMAFIIYFLLMLFITDKHISILLFTVIFVCGVCSLNLHYWDYQRDFYWQESLIEKFKEHPEVSDKSNLLFLSDDNNGCYGTRFYSLNANAAMAYQNETRLIMNGYNDLSLLQSEDLNTFVNEGYEYLMCDYDVTNKRLDGILIYNNRISYRHAIQIKLLELFDHAKYMKTIKCIGQLDYYDAESEEAESLLKGYEY